MKEKNDKEEFHYCPFCASKGSLERVGFDEEIDYPIYGCTCGECFAVVQYEKKFERI